MNNSTHSIDYKGITIICENGLYWIATNPTKKYFSLSDCRYFIDKLESEKLKSGK